jgi:uncharacterized protein (TIGR02145 family)
LDDIAGDSSSSSSGGTASDAGETVKIGTQTWMKKNLDYNAPGSVCLDNNSSNCTKYGRLYDWATAMGLDASCNSVSCSSQIGAKHRGICPSGWHIPSDADWEILVDLAGGEEIAGKKLKAKSGWNDYYGQSGNGTDVYGFSASLGRRSVGNLNSGGDGLPQGAGNYGDWWSATEYNGYRAYNRFMSYDSEDAHWNSNDKSFLFSVRCLQD